VRRVASIALVHETLSMSSDEAVEFDGIVDRVTAAAAEVAAPESKVVLRREGTFGVLPAEVATPLVMVLNELLINAVEHGFGEAEGRDGPADAPAGAEAAAAEPGKDEPAPGGLSEEERARARAKIWTPGDEGGP
jgi:hypothetical protein